MRYRILMRSPLPRQPPSTLQESGLTALCRISRPAICRVSSTRQVAGVLRPSFSRPPLPSTVTTPGVKGATPPPGARGPWIRTATTRRR